MLDESEGQLLITDCGEEAIYWSGAWFIELLESEEPKSSPWLLDALRERYPKLGLAVDPHDPLRMLVPIFLSQSTDYHNNVVKWSRELWSLTDDPFEAVEIAPKLSASYQLRRLPDSFLLFCLKDTESTPVDRHFVSMVRKLGLWSNFKLPNKMACLKYDCSDCPIKCVRHLACESFGKLTGWVQTAFYLHERLYCSAKQCNKCLLKSDCFARR